MYPIVFQEKACVRLLAMAISDSELKVGICRFFLEKGGGRSFLITPNIAIGTRASALAK